MELILEDAYIFDVNVALLFDKLIKKNIDKLNNTIPYKMMITFDVNLIKDVSIDILKNVINSKPQRKVKEDDIVNEAISSQMERFREVLKENGLESYWVHIQGDILEQKDCIKIALEEDKSEPSYTGRGKKKARLTICGVAVNMPNLRKRMGGVLNERANEIFHEFMNIIKSTSIMSEILEIEQTDNTDRLFKEFTNQYFDLINPFSDKDKNEKAVNRLREKSLIVVSKYSMTKEMEVEEH